MPRANADGTKHCPACEQTKPVADFQRNKATKDGLQYNCRPCNAEAVRFTRMKRRLIAADHKVAA